MPLVRCSDQKRQTLEQTYSELASAENKFSAEIGKSMLPFIELIKETFPQTEIYGLTSMHHLVLLATDSWKSHWFVKFIYHGTEFNIEYLMPEDISPWPLARVHGTARTMSDAKKYLIIAMTESRGWPDSQELENLYQQIIDDRTK